MFLLQSLGDWWTACAPSTWKNSKLPFLWKGHPFHPFQASTKKLSKIDSIFWTSFAAVTSKLKSLKPYLFSWWETTPLLFGGPPKCIPAQPTCPKTHRVFPPFFAKPKRVGRESKSSQSESLSPWGQGIGDPELSKSPAASFWWSENKESPCGATRGGRSPAKIK